MQNYNSKFKSDIRTRCFNFSLNVINVCDLLPNKRSAWVISDQLIRSSTSIGANLIEGRASSSRLEFKKFYEIALKSANETVYWLELLREAKLLEVISVDPLIKEAKELCSMIAAGVLKLKERKF
jgi:four helix bundle protein